MFEKETIELYNALQKKAKENLGAWRHSPVEDWKTKYWSENFNEFNLKNFRRTPLADGMISFPDRPARRVAKALKNPWFSGIPFWQKLKGVRDILWEIYKLNSVFRIKLSEINDSLVGNPCYYKFGKNNITDFAIRMCFYEKYIESDFLKIKNVLEVGGGFGGICSRILSSKKLDVKIYALVELPEILILAYWFLKNSGLKVLTIIEENDLVNLGEIKDEKTALLIAPWMLPKVNLSFDLFINTMSFQHMTKENLDYYLGEIGRMGVKNLFLVNRDAIRDKTDVKISDYPIPNKYCLVKKSDYPFTKHIIKIYKIND